MDTANYTDVFKNLSAFYLVPFLVVLAISIITYWKIYEKAGRPGWASIVPFYSQYVLFEMVGMKGWYAFLVFIPIGGAIIELVLVLMAYYKLAKCFGKSSGFGIGLVLLTFIFSIILAFDDSKYQKPEISQ